MRPFIKRMLSRREVHDLLISWFTLSLAFAWDLHFDLFLQALPVYLIVVGTAFVLHELSHKFAANALGYPAEYRMWTTGLALAVLFALATGGRFIFAAPGAVYILGRPTRRDDGIISMAGPLSNMIIAYASLYLFLVYGSPIFHIIAAVNAFIGFFNLLPLFPLDGSKILPWNPAVYFALIALYTPLLAAVF